VEKRREHVACAAKAAPKRRESLVCGDVFDAGKDAGDEWCCWGGLNSRPQPYQGWNRARLSIEVQTRIRYHCFPACTAFVRARL